MGTLAENIFTNKLEKEVYAGDFVWSDVDRIMSHDTMTWLAVTAMKKVADRLFDPSKLVVLFDHIVPPANIEQAKMQRNIMNFIKGNMIEHFYQEGVCHQVMIEKGFAGPGEIIIGSDSHTCSYGALGAFASGMGATDIGIAYATGKTWFRIPESFCININGNFPKGVYAKDLILRIIGTLGVDGATYKALEFSGETINLLSISERITLSNMAVECGAKAGLCVPDEVTMKFLTNRGKDADRKKWNDFRLSLNVKDAEYEKTFDFDVSELVPLVACPHDLDKLKTVSDVEGTELHEVFIGTCTNGRYDDLAIAAEIMKGNKVNRYTRTIIVPASVDIYRRALETGLLEIFLDSGAIVCNPGCGPCLGRHEGVLAPGERALTTMNRNFRGRMGSPDAEIYVASPATCAVSAIEGKITDPREVL